MRSALDERLVRANPVATSAVTPDPQLLERLLDQPRLALTSPRRRRHGRAAVIVALALALVGTAAAVSTFVVQYFGADDREPTPAAVVAELERINNAPDLPKVAADDFVRLAAFDGVEGRITVYGAASTVGGGYCVASATGDRFDAEGCGDTDRTAQRIPYAGLSGDSYGNAFVLYGRLAGKTVTVEIRFEDGSTKRAAVRAPFWIYVLAGEQTSPGHRPSELIARSETDSIVATQELFAPDFTSRSSAAARLPKGDGSAGQEAMRAYLGTLVRRGAGGLALAVDLSRTHELERFATPEGQFTIYEAAAAGNGVCVAYAGDAGSPPAQGSFHPDSGACFRDAPVDATPTPFAKAPPAINKIGRYVYIVEGVTPSRTASIIVRYEDGATTAVPVIYHASFAAWIGPPHLMPGRRPAALVAVGRDGQVLDRLTLDPTVVSP